MRQLYLIFFLASSFLGLAQNQSKVWIFGQGLGMDFKTDPPTFFTVPWQPTSPGYQHDGNQSTVLCDEDGELVLYFLNGKYYDEAFNMINGGQTIGYKYNLQGGIGKIWGGNESSGFFNDFNSDTIYHYYYMEN